MFLSEKQLWHLPPVGLEPVCPLNTHNRSRLELTGDVCSQAKPAHAADLSPVGALSHARTAAYALGSLNHPGFVCCGKNPRLRPGTLTDMLLKLLDSCSWAAVRSMMQLTLVLGLVAVASWFGVHAVTVVICLLTTAFAAFCLNICRANPISRVHDLGEPGCIIM